MNRRYPRSLSLAMPLLACLVAVGSAGCATTTSVSASTSTTVLSLSDASCAGCGVGSVATLEKLDGVRSASFDSKSVEVTVVHDPLRIGEQALVDAIKSDTFKVHLGAGKGSYSAEPKFAKGLDVQWVNKDGSDVDPDGLPVPGKITVVDFYAVWCGPCKDVDRAMSAVLESRSDVALRKIDVADWDSPVAKARLSGIKALPYIIVYGPDGKRRDAIAGKDLDRLHAAIGPAPAPMASKAP